MLLSEGLPRRLALMLCEEAGLGGRLADLSDKKLRAIAGLLNRWRLRPGGTEGFRTAEVTAGGIDTAALSSKTFAAKQVPGLYFRSEEHTSELQSLMRISYAVFCLKKKNTQI